MSEASRSDASVADHGKPLGDVTDQELVVSLGSRVRPLCGGPKLRAHTFCRGQYFQLPRPNRDDLYRRLGHGYREAIAAAMAVLNVARFIVPSDQREQARRRQGIIDKAAE